MGKQVKLVEALKESLALMQSFHLNAFLYELHKDVDPEVRCTDQWIEHCKGCAAARHYRKAKKLALGEQ